MKTARDAIAALRCVCWSGEPTGGHPHRAEIKAALALLRRLGVDVSTVDLTPIPVAITPVDPVPWLAEALTEPTDVTPPDPDLPPQGE